MYYYKNGIDPKLKENTRVGADRRQPEPEQDDPVITQVIHLQGIIKRRCVHGQYIKGIIKRP